MPKRIQRRRTKGWRLQEASSNPLGAIYVGRPTKWGNPFRVRGTPDAAVGMYEHCLRNGIGRVLLCTLEEVRRELHGKDLACWCPLVDKDGNKVPCHADVLLELAND